MIDADALLNGLDVRVRGEDAGVIHDALVQLVLATVRGPDGPGVVPVVPSVAMVLLDALSAAASNVAKLAASGQSRGVGGSVGPVGQGWVDVAEAHRATGAPTRSITRWASDDVIAARRIGRRAWLVQLDSLHQHLASR